MHYNLDARRLLCPMPVIRAQDRVAELNAGDALSIYSSDPGALQDIPAWARINGHKVLETRTENEDYIVVLEVSDSL